MWTRNIAGLAIFSALLLVLLGDFAIIMTSFDHNEHMYITAGVMLKANQRLYQDFAYLQMPYLPLVYRLIYALTQTTHYLLAGKLVSFLFFSLSAFMILLISHRISQNIFLSVSMLGLYLLNFTILKPAAETSNYIMPIACSLTGFYVYIVSVNEKSIKPIGVMISGLFIAIAIGAKLYYAGTALPFIVSALFFPFSVSLTRRLRVIAAPFILGILIGLLPVGYYLLQDYDAFLFNNVQYHVVNTQWRRLTGYQQAMSPFAKILFGKDIFFMTENLVILIGTLVILVFGCIQKQIRSMRRLLQSLSMEWWLALMLLVIAMATAIIPTPGFAQYFAMPVSFLFLVFGCTLTLIAEFTPVVLQSVLSLCLVLTLLHSGPTLFEAVVRFRNPYHWEGLRTHRFAHRIREELSGMAGGQKIATLSPLYVLEANLPIYHELSTGPFLYRIGDCLSSSQRLKVHGTSPQSISRLLEIDPPAAILVGFEGDLDTPLREYAKTHHYRKVEGNWGAGALYLRTP